MPCLLQSLWQSLQLRGGVTSSSDALLASLAALLAGVGEGMPLNLNVSLTPSERVQALEQQVAALSSELSTLQREYNRLSTCTSVRAALISVSRIIVLRMVFGCFALSTVTLPDCRDDRQGALRPPCTVWRYSPGYRRRGT